MGDRNGYARHLRAMLRVGSGQSTVEFAIVAIVVLIIASGIYTVWSFVSEGALVMHAADSAAHSLGPFQQLRDTFLF